LNNNAYSAADSIILALDTSSNTASLAVSRGARLLKSVRAGSNEKHERLWSDIQALLSELTMTIREIDAFAVCVGPGSFTGLRIGMAAVMGFSMPHNKPIIAVTSLEAAAFAARPARLVCSMVSAYRGEFYSQLFSFDGEGVPVPQNDPMISTLETALERVDGASEVVFAGDVASLPDVVLGKSESGAELKRSIKQSDHPLAEDISSIGYVRLTRDEVETAMSVRASYVRQSEAEIKLSLGLLGSKIKRSMKSG